MSNYPAHPVTSATPAYLAPTERSAYAAARPARLSTKAHPATSSTADRPTATFPTGWRACPSGYINEDAPRLAQADATPTGVFPTSPAPVRPQPEETPLQDMGRPGILARPSMRWHPSLMQLAIGAALVLAIIGACNVAAIQAHREARAYCHALAVSDWERAERECRGTGSGTPVPEQVPSSPHTPSPAPSGGLSPSTPPALTRVTSPSPSTQPSTQPSSSPQDAPTWVTRDTGAAYDRTDPRSTPLGLPRCTADASTPLPCLAHVSADSRHVVVLEEDASLTGLVRR